MMDSRERIVAESPQAVIDADGNDVRSLGKLREVHLIGSAILVIAAVNEVKNRKILVPS